MTAKKKKRGPGRPKGSTTSAAQKRATGSWRGRSRRQKAEDPELITRAMRRKLPPKVRPSACIAYIDGIPDYDPRRDAGKKKRRVGSTVYFERFRFDGKRAAKAINWIQQRCTHVKGTKAGEALVLSRVQRSIVANLFGWVRADGTRRYRKVLIYVARKFGKTLLAAAILLYLLVEDGEGGAEVYCAAATRDQAKLLWGPAKGMIRNDRYLQTRLRPYQHSIARLDPETGRLDDSFFQAICAEAISAHGYGPHAFAMDELHTQPDGELLDVLDTGTAARRQPVELNLTTADFDRESICNEVYKEACDVRDGRSRDPYFLPVIFEAKKGDDWRKESTWKKANPHYPVTPTRDYMKARFRKAMRNPRFRNVFLRLNLNYRTQSDVLWFDISVWDGCKKAVDWDDYCGEVAFGGLDMSSTNDLCAWALYFPRRKALLVEFWATEEAAQLREESHKIPSYRAWADQGLLTICEGGWIDQDEVLEQVRLDCEFFNVQSIGVDKWNSAKAMTELQADGIKVYQFGQGFAAYTDPCKELERLVDSGKLRHDGHDVLRWCAGNIMVQTDGSPQEGMRPVKPKTKNKAPRQDDNKIDGIVAALMAIGRSQVEPKPKESVYKHRDPIIV